MVKPSAAPSPLCQVNLTPSELSMLALDYRQKGLLFAVPPSAQLLQRLRHSLSLVILGHFHTFAGRLVTDEHRKDGVVTVFITVSIDCSGQGAEFVHAVADGVTVYDVAGQAGADLPAELIHSFFPHAGAVNYDGHWLPLLAVQVTDGIFIGCTSNYSVSDGTSFWQFFNAWADIARVPSPDQGCTGLSALPLYDRSLISAYCPRLPVKMP